MGENKDIDKNNKRIAKNSFYLYIRMFFTMAVSLYTSRVVLNTLGVYDYGIYNVVGGVVILFGFISTAMSSSTQRFLTFELGVKNYKKLNQTFVTALNIHIAIAILILILAETLGLWFVNNKLNLGEERMVAVNWVYQFSILTFMSNVIRVPYNALIIAREKMNFYAILSIAETLLKLGAVFLLLVIPFDKLKVYSILIFLVSFIITAIYIVYSNVNFAESKYSFSTNRILYRSLISFTGWSLIGNMAVLARSQGSNILLNIFFNAALNSAYGITQQVQSAVYLFMSSFQVAVTPQIIKYYATSNIKQCQRLIMQSSKLSFFLLLIIILPIFSSVDYILEIWLVNPPNYTSSFVALSLINLLIESFWGPLKMGIQATGKIKWFQIIKETVFFMNLPISYLFLKFGAPPTTVFIVSICLSFISLFIIIGILKNLINFDFKQYCLKVLFKALVVALLSGLVFYYVEGLPVSSNQNVMFIFNIISGVVITLLFVYFVGIDKSERQLLIKLLKK